MSCRNTDSDNIHSLVSVQTQLRSVQSINIPASEKCNADHRSRQILWNNTGHSHTGHIHLTDDHKKEIQNNIHNARHGKILQRSFRIPRRTENGITKIIYSQRRHPQKINPYIQHRPIDQFRLRVQEFQNTFWKYCSNKQQGQSCQNTEQESRMYSFPNSFPVSGAKIQCSQNINASRNPDQKTRKHRHKNRCRSNWSQGWCPRKTPDNGNIRHIKKHLQKIRYNKWCTEK